MEGFGVDPDQIDAEVAAERDALMFAVYRDNLPTVLCFAALATQWRVIAGGLGAAVYQGLDYSAITPLFLRTHGIERKHEAEVFMGLRIMEAAALPILNARKDDADG